MALLHYLFFLQLLLGSVIGEPQKAPELFFNRLNISYGINYKYNGQLNHDIDRVWVVTKIKIPKYEEIKFPNISFNPECKFLDSLTNGNTYRHTESIKQLCFAAFIPALASLATIAVESIGSFLQKKCNAALNKGLNAIKLDQSLAWNSIKQLDDNFLLYGKYNLDSLEKIIHTVNHLGERVHQMEELLLGKDHSVAT